MSWQQRAACMGHPSPEIFHPKPSNVKDIEQAKAVCARCPVKIECQEQAMEYGIWGGLTEEERKRLAGPGPITLKLNLPPRTCVRCGQEFKPGNKTRKYCSRQCGERLRQEQRPSRAKPPAGPRQCLSCGQDFTANSSNHRYCTPACSMRERNRSRRKKRRATHEPKACVQCGEPFTPSKKSQRFCNTSCGHVFHQAAWRARRRVKGGDPQGNRITQDIRKARAS